ncbi:hypothetical protein J8J14_09080 [Roseomonas sp. SSH11]|uniref:DUF1127 domain-containing protein n=1 Tax=Pararoseomonas baculiformis TaxID=2820812 RepID=A0ABS4AD46_9PROT|nr:hypothetical protein [Pararoseomonas baculiformis]MBP0444936.1 hypothetical protein [Pararoseomonas baculiformis]
MTMISKEWDRHLAGEPGILQESARAALRGVKDGLRGAARWVVSRYRQSEEQRLLAMLDDHMRSDIGLPARVDLAALPPFRAS